MQEQLISTQVPMHLCNQGMKLVYSDEDLESFILKIIMDWAQNDYACPNALFNFLWKIVDPPEMRTKIEMCRNWKNHLSLIHGIDRVIRSMLSQRPVVTLYDILDMVDSVYPDHRKFSGPITDFPIVKEVIFCNNNPASITLKLYYKNVIVGFSEFLNSKLNNNKGINRGKIKERQFLEFLKNKYKKSTIQELGVKITDFLKLQKAVYRYKVESLRAEVTQAMSNVMIKTKKSEIFNTDSKIMDAFETFVTLQFEDAVQKIFQPFDKESHIFQNYDLPKSKLPADDPGSIDFTKFIIRSDSDNDHVSLVSDRIKQRHVVFHQLLCDIGSFFQLNLSHDSPRDTLVTTMNRIVEMCKSITVNIEVTDITITKFKNECLSNLSKCCKSIIEVYKDKSTFDDVTSFARLQLDLLPTTYILLIRLMSEYQIIQEPKKTNEVRRPVLDIVFRSVLKDVCPTISKNNLTMESLSKVESKVLELMGLEQWPLQESFLEYVGENVKMETTILESFTDEVLSLKYGVFVPDSTNNLVLESFTDHNDSICNVMERGASKFVGVQSQILPSVVRKQKGFDPFTFRSDLSAISTAADLDNQKHLTNMKNLIMLYIIKGSGIKKIRVRTDDRFWNTKIEPLIRLYNVKEQVGNNPNAVTLSRIANSYPEITARTLISVESRFEGLVPGLPVYLQFDGAASIIPSDDPDLIAKHREFCEKVNSLLNKQISSADKPDYWMFSHRSKLFNTTDRKLLLEKLKGLTRTTKRIKIFLPRASSEPSKVSDNEYLDYLEEEVEEVEEASFYEECFSVKVRSGKKTKASGYQIKGRRKKEQKRPD